MKPLYLLALLLTTCCSMARTKPDLDSLRETGIQEDNALRHDKALAIFYKGLILSREWNDPRSEGMLLTDIGCAYQNMGKIGEALSYYEKASVLAENHNDSTLKAGAFRNMASIYVMKGDYKKASSLLSDAALIFAAVGNHEDHAAALNTIGTIQFRLKDLTQALYFFKRALEAYEQAKKDPSLSSLTSNFDLDIAIALHNIGEVFKEKGAYDSAIVYLKRSLLIKQRLKMPAYEATTLNMLGEIHHALKEYRMAMRYLNRAYHIRLNLSDSPAFAQSLISLSSLFYDLHHYHRAEELSAKAESICKNDSLLNDLLKVYEIRRQVFRKLNAPESALTYDNLYISLLKHITNTEQLRTIYELHTRYQSELKDKDLAALQKRVEWSNELNVAREKLIYVISIASVVVVTILVLAYFQKRKSKKRLELMMRELNHRVKNNFQQLNALLSLYKKQLDDEPARKAITETANRVNAMGLVHARLYLDDRQITHVRLDHFIAELTRDLMSGYGFSPGTLKPVLALDPVSLHADKALALSLIINELITNAFKHALQNHPAPELHIALKSDRRAITLAIADNGRTLQAHPSHRSFGTDLVNLLCRQLNATLEKEHGNGLTIKITIPQAP